MAVRFIWIVLVLLSVRELVLVTELIELLVAGTLKYRQSGLPLERATEVTVVRRSRRYHYSTTIHTSGIMTRRSVYIA